ncbi:hypothetical protein JL720_9401 [Aureococcus anophagefferens]|nr:hypothetical protein JL720_9401 [Aureococcus anophagefferens]
MGFWLEGDLESARKRQAGDCAFEEDVAGYVWPALTLPGEGLNGWRPIVASAAAVAKRLGYGLVLPCVADSELACCVDASAPAGPWLWRRRRRGGRAAGRRADLRRRARGARQDLRAYLDVAALEAFVGSPVVPPRCLAAGAPRAPRRRRRPDARDLDVGDGEARWRALAASADDDATPVLVARRRRRGIFALGDWWRADPPYPPRLPRRRALRGAGRRGRGRAVPARALGDEAPPDVAEAKARALQRLLDAGVAKYDAVLDWDDRGELGLVEQQLALDADVAWAQADAATDPPFKVGIGPCGWQGRFIRTVLDARAHDGRPVRSWYDPELVLWPPS